MIEMSSFALPSYDELSTLEYSFSEFQKNIVDSISTKINEIYSGMNFDDGIGIRTTALYAAKYYVNKFTRNSLDIILLYCFDNGYIYYKITENPDTLIEVLYNFISINLSQYGVFTKYWEPLNLYLILFSGDENDIVLYARANGDDEEASQMNDIIDRSFESNREEVIEKTFSCNHEHEIKIDGNVERNEENEECHLCYERASYQCFKCGYPICDKCMNVLKTSTGKCPCCQIYPLLLKKINDRQEK